MSGEDSIPRLNNLAKTMGIEITEFSEGSCVVECTVGERHLNMGGVAHGGVHATMLDTAMGGTLVSILAKEEWCATAQIDISCLKPCHSVPQLFAIKVMICEADICDNGNSITDSKPRRC